MDERVERGWKVSLCLRTFAIMICFDLRRRSACMILRDSLTGQADSSRGGGARPAAADGSREDRALPTKCFATLNRLCTATLAVSYVERIAKAHSGGTDVTSGRVVMQGAIPVERPSIRVR